MTSTSDPDKLAEYFDAEETTVPTGSTSPSYNVAPTDRVFVVAEHHGTRQLGTMKWGLVPFYSKDGFGGARRVNTRADTVAHSNTYQRILQRRRCIIPADGFFEWQASEGKTKQPWYFTSKSGNPLAFAGLWDIWRDPNLPRDAQRLVTCTIITTEANQDVSSVHDRMPLALRNEDWEMWLHVEDSDLDGIRTFLANPQVDELTAVPVSSRVGSVTNNSTENIRPIETDPNVS